MAARDDLEMVWLIHDKRQLAKLPAGDYMLVNHPEDARETLPTGSPHHKSRI